MIQGETFLPFCKSCDVILSDKLATHSISRPELSKAVCFETNTTDLSLLGRGQGDFLHHYNLSPVYNPHMSDGLAKAWTNSKSPDLWLHPSGTALSNFFYWKPFYKQFHCPSLIQNNSSLGKRTREWLRDACSCVQGVRQCGRQRRWQIISVEEKKKDQKVPWGLAYTTASR